MVITRIARVWVDERRLAILRAALGDSMALPDDPARDLTAGRFEEAQRMKLVHAVRMADPCDAARAERYQRLAECTGRLQEEAWVELDSALRAAGVATLVLKGLFFHNVPSDIRMPRYCMHDVDLLVRAGDRSRAGEVMLALNYSQQFTISDELRIVPRGADDRTPDVLAEAPFIRLADVDPALVASTAGGPAAGVTGASAGGLQSPFVVDGTAVSFGVAFELHLAPVPDTEPGLFWVRPQAFTVHGRRALAPSETTLAWYLPFHFYVDVVRADKPAANLLVELHRLLLRRRINWSELADVVSTYEWLKRPLAYVYDFYAALTGRSALPAAIDELLHSAAPPFIVGKPWYDYGELSLKLLGGTLRYELAR